MEVVAVSRKRQQGCSCAPLARILHGGAGTIDGFDHFCEATQAESRRDWVESVCFDRDRAKWIGPFPRALQIDSTRWTQPVQPGDGARPIQIAQTSQEIIAVIRQVVEPPPEEIDEEVERKMLGRAPGIESVFRCLDLATAHLGGAVSFEFIDKALPECLLGSGAPDTPEAARYLWDRYIRKRRKIVVTSFILGAVLAVAEGRLARPAEVVAQVSGSTTWADKALWAQASATAWGHGHWWSRFPSKYQQSLPDKVKPMKARNGRPAVPSRATGPLSDRRGLLPKQSDNDLGSDAATLAAGGTITRPEMLGRERERRLTVRRQADVIAGRPPAQKLDAEELRRCDDAVRQAISRAKNRRKKTV